MSNRFFVGLDLGQSQDYTALVVLERVGAEHHLRHIERFKLGTSYPDIVKRVKDLMSEETLKEAPLVIDQTGVGRPVFDMLYDTEISCVGITITGGDTINRDGNNFRIPKRDLVSTLQVLFQSGRLKVAEGLPEASLLVQELLNFKVKINVKTAHDSYEAWREGVHDDLVLATALACWYAEKYGPSDGLIFMPGSHYWGKQSSNRFDEDEDEDDGPRNPGYYSI